MPKKIIILCVLVSLAALIFSLGVFAGFKIGGDEINVRQNTFQAGYEAAKKRLAEGGFFPIMGQIEVKTVSGEVKEIRDGEIVLKIRPLEPLADSELDERIAEVGEETKIYQLTQKDQTVYQKEMEEFNKKLQEQAQDGVSVPPVSFTPPTPFDKKEISLSLIKAGRQISISSQNDIKNAKRFKAAEITISPAL
ncbi:hypothetical protein HY798_02050 [Candidatus Falkowbacteria bacterium]|nr:hypothetical protein [Candidatus Falkowbacteria bacterium]